MWKIIAKGHSKGAWWLLVFRVCLELLPTQFNFRWAMSTLDHKGDLIINVFIDVTILIVTAIPRNYSLQT